MLIAFALHFEQVFHFTIQQGKGAVRWFASAEGSVC